ncbi:MAG: HD domain-containing protein, partial [Bdellovibrio sp.]
IDPLYVACLIDNRIPSVDDFFEEDGLCFRTILSQVISSELDVDRMDYLERDAFFCGTSYGKVETSWLLSNLTYHINSSHGNNLHLALNRRALYTFDDFLLSRHHMHLMVYFHHKSIIYEEMLLRYLTSKDCQFFLPADIDQYIKYTDYYLYEHLASVDNKWAQRIAKQNPYKMLFEFHSTEKTNRLPQMKQVLEEKGIHCILSNSTTRLSKYHSGSLGESERSIFVVDQYDKQANPYPIEKSTEIFHKYEEIRRIERIYVDPQHFMEAQTIIEENKL